MALATSKSHGLICCSGRILRDGDIKLLFVVSRFKVSVLEYNR